MPKMERPAPRARRRWRNDIREHSTEFGFQPDIKLLVKAGARPTRELLDERWLEIGDEIYTEWARAFSEDLEPRYRRPRPASWRPRHVR
jgi:hypothetical protein